MRQEHPVHQTTGSSRNQGPKTDPSAPFPAERIRPRMRRLHPSDVGPAEAGHYRLADSRADVGPWGAYMWRQPSPAPGRACTTEWRETL